MIVHENVAALLAELATEPSRILQKHYEAVTCKLCGGLDGAHGLVHVRFEQGGGGVNRPCPASLGLETGEK